jgi:parallel beta-helix repeat protein
MTAFSIGKEKEMQRIKSLSHPLAFVAALVLSVVGSGNPLSAATLCVNPGGTNGCFAKIGAAAAAASPNDTVRVLPGTYAEDVVIGKPLSLVGAGRSTTIIDAAGLSNGVYINGRDNAGLNNVVVTGFEIKNANFEGILITNASTVTVWNNHVFNNDKSLDPTVPTCPGIPSFETGEDFDCGEGIHLLGVDHSIVTNNLVENNSGGILLSDDTGKTHDNLVSGNSVRDDPFDCGITMASHAPAPGSQDPHWGVVHNTIAGNMSFHNGTEVPGAGAGVGLFSDGSGPGLMSSNVVINNDIRNNGLPGVAFHSHAPGDTFADNMIVSNQISANKADEGDTTTPGPTGINVNSGFGMSPISGTIIAQNTIDQEAVAVAINTPVQVSVNLNNFVAPTVGVDNLGTGTVNALENWWACTGGPAGGSGCAGVAGPGILFAPWLGAPFK